jgi:acyl-CoA thioesterase FadM
MFELEVEVTSSDLDPTYHHLHHARALLYLEQARLAFLKAIGFSAEKLIETDLFPVITAIDIRYLREIMAGTYKATCEECKVDGRTLKIAQRVLNPKGKSCIEAKVDSMLLQGKARRGVAPPPEFIEAFERWLP